MSEYSCYSKVRNENLPVSFEIPVAEPKVVTDVRYFEINNRRTSFAVQSKSIASLSRIVLGVLATTGPVSKSSDAEPSKSSPKSSFVQCRVGADLFHVCAD